MKAVKDSRDPLASLLAPCLHSVQLRRGHARIHQGLPRSPVRAAEMKTFIWMEGLCLRASAACIFCWLTVMRFRRLLWAVPVVSLPSQLALGTLNHLGHWHGSATRPLIHTSLCSPPLHEAKNTESAVSRRCFAASLLRLIHLREVKWGGKMYRSTFTAEAKLLLKSWSLWMQRKSSFFVSMYVDSVWSLLCIIKIQYRWILVQSKWWHTNLKVTYSSFWTTVDLLYTNWQRNLNSTSTPTFQSACPLLQHSAIKTDALMLDLFGKMQKQGAVRLSWRSFSAHWVNTSEPSRVL